MAEKPGEMRRSGFRVEGLGLMEKKMETTIMGNQMEKKMENDMETGIIMILGVRVTWTFQCSSFLGLLWFFGLGLLLGLPKRYYIGGSR